MEWNNRKVTTLISAAAFVLIVFTIPRSTEAQICIQPPAGMVNWWPGDGNATDIEGTNNGTPQNGATFAPGVVGQAFSFDGVDDRVDLAAPVSPAGNLTVEGWFNPASFGSVAIINRLTVMHADNGFPVFGFGIIADFPFNGSLVRKVDLVARDSAGMSLFVRSNSQLTVGVPAHVAWTWDAATRTGSVYVNGTFETSDSNPSIDLSSLPLLLAIGATTRTATLPYDHFHGLIDELTVYNRVLVPNEIQAIYLAGSAGKCKDDEISPEALSQQAYDIITALPLAAVTTRGNQNALTNFLSQAIVAIQNNHLATARDKVEEAIERTDGCVLRGAPDGSGPGRDWITSCAAQMDIYDLLTAALAALPM